MYFTVGCHKSSLCLVDQFHNLIHLFLHSNIFSFSFCQFFIYLRLYSIQTSLSLHTCLFHQHITFLFCVCNNSFCFFLGFQNQIPYQIITVYIFLIFYRNIPLQPVFLFFFYAQSLTDITQSLFLLNPQFFQFILMLNTQLIQFILMLHPDLIHFVLMLSPQFIHQLFSLRIFQIQLTLQFCNLFIFIFSCFD